MTDVTRRSACALGAAVLGNLITYGPLQANAVPLNLRRGINIHNLLNWPVIKPSNGEIEYVWPPFVSAAHIVKDWELQRLSGLGFDFIRLTVDPAIFCANDGVKRDQLNGILIERVKWLNAAGFSVIVDMAPISQNPKFTPERVVAIDDPSTFETYCHSIAAIAGVLASLPDAKVIFEPINEPILQAAEFPRWQSMAEHMHGVIRAAAPNLPVLMTGALYGHFKALLRFDPLPFKGSNLYYTFHYYDPHTFTHQGVDKEECRYIHGLGWPPAPDSKEDVLNRALEAIVSDSKLDEHSRARFKASTKKFVDDYYAGNNTSAQIAADFDAVANWASAHDIPNSRIVLGEFGLQRDNGPPRADRIKWLSTVKDNAEKHQFPWSLWVYRSYGGMAFVDETAAHRMDDDVIAALQLRGDAFHSLR